MSEVFKRPYRRADETRVHVLQVAKRLFYANGIHAVGIDRIANEAQVTVTTLYRLFGSKDGLVAAYLRRADQEWFERLDRTVAEGGLLHLFEDLDEEARDPDNRGCVFRLALSEYPSDCECHVLAIENKRRTEARFCALLTQAGCEDPHTKAEQLMLIMDGIEASAAGRGPESGPGIGPKLARELLGDAGSRPVRISNP